MTQNTNKFSNVLINTNISGNVLAEFKKKTIQQYSPKQQENITKQVLKNKKEKNAVTESIN